MKECIEFLVTVFVAILLALLMGTCEILILKFAAPLAQQHVTEIQNWIPQHEDLTRATILIFAIVEMLFLYGATRSLVTRLGYSHKFVGFSILVGIMIQYKLSLEL